MSIPPHSISVPFSRRRFLKALALLGAGGVAAGVGLPAVARAESRVAAVVAEKNIADLGQYLVSEKLDGVRARWDGKQLLSRNQNRFAAPEWFAENFPAETMDGELWMRRGAFQAVSGIVRRKTPGDEWRNIRFVVFDLPNAKAPFAERARRIPELVAGRAPHLAYAPQFGVASEAELAERFANIVQNGGEGLMLRKKDSTASRASDIVKLKLHDDADAVVVAHNPGKGKHLGRLGSLTVRGEDGKQFRVGTGFSDFERENPPPHGAVITYRHQGRTDSGLPRFPVFMRVRNEEPPQ